MSAITKPNQIRIRIRDDDNELIGKLADDATLTNTDVASMLLRAAAQAVRQSTTQTSLLPRLRVDEDGEIRLKSQPKKIK